MFLRWQLNVALTDLDQEEMAVLETLSYKLEDFEATIIEHIEESEQEITKGPVETPNPFTKEERAKMGIRGAYCNENGETEYYYG